jgi:hypothetical protein
MSSNGQNRALVRNHLLSFARRVTRSSRFHGVRRSQASELGQAIHVAREMLPAPGLQLGADLRT